MYFKDKKHKNSMSDVREIMKETKESYLEEESKKTIKEKKNSNTKKKNVSENKKITFKIFSKIATIE